MTNVSLMEDPYEEYQDIIFLNESRRRDSCGSAGKSSRRASGPGSTSRGDSVERRVSLGDHSPTKSSSFRDASKQKKKKEQMHKKQRDADRRRKRDACEGHVDPGYTREEQIGGDSAHGSDSKSAHSSGEPHSDDDSESEDELHANIRLALQQAAVSPKKKKLILAKLGMTTADIPLKQICEGPLCKTLHKLSLAQNPLESVPDRLVRSLPMLVHLDLSSCRIHQLPPVWYLPRLQILNLSENLLCDFPDEASVRSVLGWFHL